MIKLGQMVIHLITGFEGIATSRVEYLTGCIQVGLTRKMKDGDDKPPEAHYFDEPFCEVIGESGLEKPATAEQNGGPRDTPPGHHGLH